MGRTLTKALSRVIDDLENVSFSISASAGALTIAIKDFLGNDPTPSTPLVFGFRNATLINGNPQVQRSVIAATSVVVPSTSTCGFLNATAARLWIIGWDDAGTFRLGVFNAFSNGTPQQLFGLDESGIGSSLQVVAAGNAAGQHYTAGAAVTSKAFRILGYVDWNASGVATAGTWTTTNLNSIVTFGPGISRPGQIIKTIINISTSNTSTASASYVALGQTQAITPTSAANPILATTQGSMNNSVSANAFIAFVRGSTIVGTPCKAAYAANGGNPTNHIVLDLPNSAASVTYGFQGKTDAGTLTYPVTGAGSVLMLQELMG